MKIIYYGSISTTAFDFPLLKEYQRHNVDVVAYFLLSNWNKNSGLINAEDIPHTDRIYKAAEIPSFNVYSSYFNLDKVYVINSYHHKRYQWQSWILWVKVLLHMMRQKASVVHFVWPLTKCQKILYMLKCKKLLTVHDPFPHSSQENSYDEKCRRKAFDQCDKLVVLNQVQDSEFQKHYNISSDMIAYNRLGEDDCLKIVQPNGYVPEGKYILFFGQIQSHKGVDDLLEAMRLVHEKYPDVKVVIAGKGKFHFDIEPYELLDYVEIRNYYISVPELATLLQNCLFAVCPYRDATQSGVVQTAFSANVPLIVSNVGALPEAVKDGVTGLVVPSSNVKALQTAIEKLITNPSLLSDFRKNIDMQWRPTMSWAPIAEKYIECYKELSQKK